LMLLYAVISSGTGRRFSFSVHSCERPVYTSEYSSSPHVTRATKSLFA
jgi:hypothetical protein